LGVDCADTKNDTPAINAKNKITFFIFFSILFLMFVPFWNLELQI